MEPRTEETGQVPPHPIGQLIQGMPFEQYIEADGMNSHGIIDILRSEAHFYEKKVNRVKQKETDALLFGRLFHLAVLEPALYKEKALVMPEFIGFTKDGKESKQSAEAKEKKAKWLASVPPGAIVVPDKFVAQLTGMAEKVLAHPMLRRILESSVRESVCFWRDDETGELCKMRTDLITAKAHIVDFKTSRDARPRWFSKQMFDYGGHIQAAHYLSGARHTGVARHDRYIWVAIEKEPPYEIGIYPAGQSVLGVGEQWRSEGMRRYARAKKLGRWPGYNPDAQVLELPPYAEGHFPDEEQGDDGDPR